MKPVAPREKGGRLEIRMNRDLRIGLVELYAFTSDSFLHLLRSGNSE
jgi:hypothetical protein